MAAGLCGCARHTAPVVAAPELTAAEADFEELWQASLDVLERFRFTVDRRDRRAGVIATLPMTSKHWTEFWRRDAVTSTDVAESTIQTIYRTARVTVRGGEGEGERGGVSVQVLAFRSDRPSPQVTSTSEAYGLFLLPGAEDVARSLLMEAELREGTVTPLGRDLLLEKRIEADILSAAGR